MSYMQIYAMIGVAGQKQGLIRLSLDTLITIASLMYLYIVGETGN